MRALKAFAFVTWSVVVLVGTASSSPTKKIFVKYGYTEEELCSGSFISRLGREAANANSGDRKVALDEIRRLMKEAAKRCTSPENSQVDLLDNPSADGDHEAKSAEVGAYAQSKMVAVPAAILSGGDGDGGESTEDRGGNGCRSDKSLDGHCQNLICITFHPDSYVLEWQTHEPSMTGDSCVLGQSYPLGTMPSPPKRSSPAFHEWNLGVVLIDRARMPLKLDELPQNSYGDWCRSTDKIGPRARNDVALVVPIDRDSASIVYLVDQYGHPIRQPRELNRARDLARVLVDSNHIDEIMRSRRTIQRVLATFAAFDPMVQVIDGFLETSTNKTQYLPTVFHSGGQTRFLSVFAFEESPHAAEPLSVETPWLSDYTAELGQRGHLRPNERALISSAIDGSYVLSAVPSTAANLMYHSPVSILETAFGGRQRHSTEEISEAIVNGQELYFLTVNKFSSAAIRDGRIVPTWYEPAFEKGGASNAFLEVIQNLAILNPSYQVVLEPDSSLTMALYDNESGILWGIKMGSDGTLRDQQLLDSRTLSVWGEATADGYITQLMEGYDVDRRFLREWILSGLDYELLDHAPLTSDKPIEGPFITFFAEKHPSVSRSNRWDESVISASGVVLGPTNQHSFLATLVGRQSFGTWSDFRRSYLRMRPKLLSLYGTENHQYDVHLWDGPRGKGLVAIAPVNSRQRLTVFPSASSARLLSATLGALQRMTDFDASWSWLEPRLGKTPDLEVIMGGCLADRFESFGWRADPIGLFDRAESRAKSVHQERTNQNSQVGAEHESKP